MRFATTYIGLVPQHDFAKYYVLSKANDTSFLTSCLIESTNATSLNPCIHGFSQNCSFHVYLEHLLTWFPSPSPILAFTTLQGVVPSVS